MGIFDFLRKRQASTDKYTDASLTLLDKSGKAKQQPFNYSSAIRLYSSWVYAAATMNAQAVAANPLRLYVRSRPGRKLFDTRPVSRSRKAYLRGDAQHQPSHVVMRKAIAGEFEEVATDHPVLEVLRKANSVDDGFGLATTRILFLELTGNAYLHPVFDPVLGVPAELWTMPSHRVKILPSEDGLIGGYRYGMDTQSEVDFSCDEVIHFKRPNPKSLLYGLGKVEAAWSVIQQSEAMHDMDYSFFENMARPDYAIIVKGGAGREQLDRFETKVREALQGTRKAGKFLAISGDIEMQPLSFPPKDLNGREDVVEEIAAIFGVPVSMLKANDPNLAAAKSGYAQWRESTIAPICRLDEETLNAKLLPMFGIEEDAYLAYDNPVPADRQQDLVERQASVAGGWMTPNEARLEAGYDPMPDPAADRLYLGGQPLGATAQPQIPFGPFGASIQPPMLPEAQEQPQDEPQPLEQVQASKRYDSKPLDTSGSDCISNNIATLLDEGYPREQAIAIAISVCEGKSMEQAKADAKAAQEAKVEADAKQVAKAALDIAAQIDRSAQDEDAVQISRLMDAVEKGYMRDLTDDETIRYALEGAVAAVDADVDAILKAYDLDASETILKAKQ
jgi:HK97 family phage portal protein